MYNNALVFPLSQLPQAFRVQVVSFQPLSLKHILVYSFLPTYIQVQSCNKTT
jgi:hypothetical protein